MNIPIREIFELFSARGSFRPAHGLFSDAGVGRILLLCKGESFPCRQARKLRNFLRMIKLSNCSTNKQITNLPREMISEKPNLSQH